MPLDAARLVERAAAEFRPEDVERAVRLVEMHDPRRMKSGTLRTLPMTGADLDLVVNYLVKKKVAKDRLVAKGYGPTTPRVAIDKSKPKKELAAASSAMQISLPGRYLAF